ncbi:unnamed protein product [Ambrosiozyma monospora]|uniref:Unnamed protein product n=1 Tax=Ambrosiozyma monospora TaxID=43982 RepID=A0ACB5U7L3_AMBMO|nr:unnamed protein product [Ambrosiozyma monospora]
MLNSICLTSKKDQVIDLKALDSTFHIPIPTPTTYETVIRHHLEISGPVSRQFLKSVVQFSPDETTHKTVLTLGDDKELFHKEITSQYLNIADALLKLSNANRSRHRRC